MAEELIEKVKIVKAQAGTRRNRRSLIDGMGSPDDLGNPSFSTGGNSGMSDDNLTHLSQVGRFKEIGDTGLRRWTGVIFEEFLPELTGKRAIKVYREMSANDPTVGAMLFAIEMLMRQVDWKVVGNDEKNCQFIEENMRDMSHTWEEFVGEVLSMLPYGWSFHEICYKLRHGPDLDENKNSEFKDGLIGWSKLPIRAQDTLHEWIFGPHGEILGMVQMPPPDYGLRTIPMDKALLFRPSAHKNNPEGRSVLRAAYLPWYFVKRLRQIEAIGIERDLAGLPVLTGPERLDLFNDKDPAMVALRASAEKMVSHVRRDEYEGVVLPFGWELTLLSTGGRRSIDVSATITRYKQEIAMTALADFIMLGHESEGSFALASSKTNVFTVAMRSWLEAISEIINRHAIPRLIRMNPNLNQTDLPRIEPNEIEAPDLNELSNYIQSLMAVGALTPSDTMENVLRALADLPEMDGTERLAVEPAEWWVRENVDTAPDPGSVAGQAAASPGAQGKIGTGTVDPATGDVITAADTSRTMGNAPNLNPRSRPQDDIRRTQMPGSRRLGGLKTGARRPRPSGNG